jgi:hypothetical protein
MKGIAVPVSTKKAAQARRDWYSISVDTLRGFGILLGVLALVGLSVVVIRVWEYQVLKRDADHVIRQAGGLLQRVQGEKGLSRFATEYASARQSLQDARAKLADGEFSAARDDGQRSRSVLQGILDKLSPNGAAGQAQFVDVEGEVEYRRGDGGDWQEAHRQVQLQPGDYVRTSESGSAEIMFIDGSLYTVRPNTQFIVAPGSSGSRGPADQSIEMAYGWVNLNTSDKSNNVRTPGAVARVREQSEAFVAVDKETSQGRFGAFHGGVEVASQGGLTREVGPLQQVVQTGDLLSEPKPLPSPPEPLTPGDDEALDLERTRRVVLSWTPVQGAARYALQVSRNQLFVDNIIDVENRAHTRATLGLRGEGSFEWRVAAYGADGLQGPWSQTRGFRVVSSRSAGGEKRDTTPPELEIDEVKTYGNIFMISGRSEAGARIEVNGELVKTDVDGTFNKTVELTKEGWNIIEIRARDAWGNESVRRHRVFVENP